MAVIMPGEEGHLGGAVWQLFCLFLDTGLSALVTFRVWLYIAWPFHCHLSPFPRSTCQGILPASYFPAS